MKFTFAGYPKLLAFLILMGYDLAIIAVGFTGIACLIMPITIPLKDGGYIAWSVIGNLAPAKANPIEVLTVFVCWSILCLVSVMWLLGRRAEAVINRKYGHLSETERHLNFKVREDIRSIRGG